MDYLEKPIFLCGAPRSGTTLLHTLFDSVDGIVSIPVENHIGDKFYEYSFHHPNQLHEYFLRDFIFNFDLQISYNKEYQKFLGSRAKKRFGDHTETPTIENLNEEKVNSFISVYQEMLTKHKEFELSAPFKALAHAYAKTMYDLDERNQKYFIHRRNLVNETQAIQLKQVFPNAKFIHLLRDPRTRYLSAKQRAIKKRRLFGKYVPNVGELDFCSHRAIVSMYSFMLAERNKKVIGEDYLIIKQEDLADNRENVMKTLAEKLSLPFTSELLQPTMYGVKTTGNSSFQEKQEDTERKIKERLSRYKKETSSIEQYIINYYCARIASEFGYELPITNARGFKNTLALMKHERFSDFWHNRKKSLRMITSNYVLQHNKQYEKMYQQIISGKQIVM